MMEKIKIFLLDYMVKREKEKQLEQERKAILEAREHEIKLKKLDVQEKLVSSGASISNDDTLNDKEAIEQMEKSWKDEIIMVILFTPIIISFIPSSQETSMKGFEILKTVPEWYMALVVGITVAIYGLRGVVRVVSQCKKPTV